jgi:uncharacterized protein with GYD domain
MTQHRDLEIGPAGRYVMAKYLMQFTYTNDAMGELVKRPEDRGAMISALFDRLGGKIEVFYHCLGEYDVVYIAEFPDNETLAAFKMAVRSTGVEKDHKITPLLSREEAVRALTRAGGAGYRAPGD